MVSNEEKRTYGLLGRNITYSLSPAMHNAAFDRLKINGEYRLFDKQEDELEGFLKNDVLSGKVAGLNVTVPYKIKFKELLDLNIPKENVQHDGFVQATGSLNTVKIDSGKVYTYNTDADGFWQSVFGGDVSNLHWTNELNFLVIGAGGAGRVIAFYMMMRPRLEHNKVYAYDVDMGKVNALTESLKRCRSIGEKYRRIGEKYFPLGNLEEVGEHITDYDVVVNATPLGTKETDPMPLEPELLLRLKKTAVIYDLVYARETELIREAKKHGLRTANGLGMLVNQGALSFQKWNPDVVAEPKVLDEVKKVMRETAEKELGKRK